MALNWRATYGRQARMEWVAHFPATSQCVVIGPAVQRHLRKHRQTTPWASEAGGQLFGTVDVEVVCVSAATGPYCNDIRSRYSFRSDPRLAQRAIEAYAKRGLLYLGEWHTHAQNMPKPSISDFEAIECICRRSKLNTTGVLLIVV